MKLVVIAIMMCLSGSAQAASLWIGDLEVTKANLDPAITDMYDFARYPSKHFCFEGDSKEVISLIEEILAIGTGDSEVIATDVQLKNESISVKFDWIDEAGDHSARKIVALCN